MSFFYVCPSGPGYAGRRVRSGPLFIAEERDAQVTTRTSYPFYPLPGGEVILIWNHLLLIRLLISVAICHDFWKEKSRQIGSCTSCFPWVVTQGYNHVTTLWFFFLCSISLLQDLKIIAVSRGCPLVHADAAGKKTPSY